ELRAFLTTGFLGGFTTFSAFSLEFALLCEKNLWSLAFAYAVLSVVSTLGGFFIAIRLVRFFAA
ncbi:MAG: CrcB family protein, partial [Alphaproteobacteria bacterium]|nr:CrcB family protein [Alphaproteobacteria bacterium]MBX9976692.1 CrcB family protein [Alphaproteobacteria bacterium]